MAKDTRNRYKGITFAVGYDRTFEQFKAEFEDVHVFKKMQPKLRLAELKIAHKIATTKAPDEK